MRIVETSVARKIVRNPRFKTRATRARNAREMEAIITALDDEAFVNVTDKTRAIRAIGHEENRKGSGRPRIVLVHKLCTLYNYSV